MMIERNKVNNLYTIEGSTVTSIDVVSAIFDSDVTKLCHMRMWHISKGFS